MTVTLTPPTWNDLTTREKMQAVWWDLYKDVHGVRPRSIDTSTWSEEDFERELARLETDLALAQDQQAYLEAEATARLEDTIQTLIASGAKDRYTAVRWLAESMGTDFSDPDYLCYLLGIPYGYFQEV